MEEEIRRGEQEEVEGEEEKINSLLSLQIRGFSKCEDPKGRSIIAGMSKEELDRI